MSDLNSNKSPEILGGPAPLWPWCPASHVSQSRAYLTTSPSAEQYQLRAWACCLMAYHVHFVVVPGRENALAKTLGRTRADYARNFNLQQRSCRHVWQARFFSCPLDRWSSAAVHTGGEDAGIVHLEGWRKQYTVERWRELLRTSVGEEALIERLREATLRGRPFGSDEFMEELERKTDRRLHPLPVGRPKKTASDADREQQLQLQLEIGV